MSTSSVSPSSGKLRMSRARFLVNTTLPAPIKATLTLETSSQPARGVTDRPSLSVGLSQGQAGIAVKVPVRLRRAPGVEAGRPGPR